MICENPLRNDGRVFILHSRPPLILAEAFHFEIEDEKNYMDCKRQFDIGASVDYPGELICLGAILHQATTPDQKGADQLAKIMSRMGEWYHAYLKYEDNNINKNLL